jgi:hypothetical protein
MVGMFNEMTYFNGVQEKVEDLVPLIDKWGSPETFPHMAAGVERHASLPLRRHPDLRTPG